MLLKNHINLVYCKGFAPGVSTLNRHFKDKVLPLRRTNLITCMSNSSDFFYAIDDREDFEISLRFYEDFP